MKSFIIYFQSRAERDKDAAVASLFSRKTYGTDEKLNFISEGKKRVRAFCNEYKLKYKNPYDLIKSRCKSSTRCVIC